VTLVYPPGGKRAWRARPEALAFGALAFCIAVYMVPMLTLGVWAFRDRSGAFTLAHLSRLIGDEVYHDAFLTTFRTATVTTVACVILGYPLAYLMATSGHRARILLFTAVMIPFWTSVLARSLAWVILLGRRGVVNQWLVSSGITDQPVPLLFNSIGVQIGMVHVLLPFMILPIWSVLTRLDPALPLAARSLGATRGRAFFYVVLPQSLPGLAAGMTLVFMLAVGFYITPALLGGPNDLTIVSLIEMVVRDLLDWSFGALLSLTLLALVGAIFGVGAMVAGADRFTGAEARA
jgi:putative spermidine/putrescine transport system permease protein